MAGDQGKLDSDGWIDRTHPSGDEEQEYMEMLFGRGPGDPDFHTPPWEDDDDNDREVV